MNDLMKAFISGAAGAYLSTKVEPMISKSLASKDPANPMSPTTLAAVHYGVAGASAVAVFYALGLAKV
jgi:hypothetical protein